MEKELKIARERLARIERERDAALQAYRDVKSTYHARGKAVRFIDLMIKREEQAAIVATLSAHANLYLPAFEEQEGAREAISELEDTRRTAQGTMDNCTNEIMEHDAKIADCQITIDNIASRAESRHADLMSGDHPHVHEERVKIDGYWNLINVLEVETNSEQR